MDVSKRIAIVTGASSGMGREFVKQLDKCLRTVDEIWLIARREDRLQELKESMKNITARVLSLDICKEADLNELKSTLDVEQTSVRLLVNAAGVGRAGRFDEITRKEALNMVDVNVKALVAITHMVLPYVKEVQYYSGSVCICIYATKRVCSVCSIKILCIKLFKSIKSRSEG